MGNLKTLRKFLMYKGGFPRGEIIGEFAAKSLLSMRTLVCFDFTSEMRRNISPRKSRIHFYFFVTKNFAKHFKPIRTHSNVLNKQINSKIQTKMADSIETHMALDPMALNTANVEMLSALLALQQKQREGDEEDKEEAEKVDLLIKNKTNKAII